MTQFPEPHERSASAIPNTCAFAALLALFLYRDVLGRELAGLDNVVRAKRPVRLPLVLSRADVASILGEMQGVPWLMASLMDGAGLLLLASSNGAFTVAVRTARVAKPVHLCIFTGTILSFENEDVAPPTKRMKLTSASRRAAVEEPAARGVRIPAPALAVYARCSADRSS